MDGRYLARGEMTEHIDIIMATHNHLDLTMQAVDALYTHTNGPFTLTAVDDSTDLTNQYFEQLARERGNINFVHSDIPYVHGNQIINVGLKNTRTPAVVYLGNNVKVEPDWLDVAQQIINGDAEVGIIGFKLLYNSGTIEHAGIFWTPEMPHHMNIGVNEAGHRFSFVREVDMIGFALVLFRRAVFPDGLDEKTFIGFRGYDDIDNCMDAKRRGWKIIYCGLGAAYHQAGASRQDSEQYALEHEQNRITFLKKWGATDKAINSSVITRVVR